MNERSKITWAKHAMVLETLVTIKTAEWGCGLPPTDSLPSEELEQEVDVWAGRLADDLDGEMNPPGAVAPWLLARITSMLTVAKVLDGKGDTDAPELTPHTMRQFLVEEWHGALRDRWCLMLAQDLVDGVEE